MTIDLSDVQFDVLLKRLHLANTRRAWRDLVQRAERDEWSYRDFLALLVSEEIAHRQQTRIARMVRRAHFPFFKTIDDFNFTYQSTVRLSLLGSALAADFVTEGRCLIFGGKPGRGKTHLAVAIAYRAIQHGFDALFVTAAELIDDLSGAFRRGQLADALARYVHPAVIVIDEVGYLTYGTDAANMLFHVVNDRHRKKRAMIFTTNKPLTAWGRVLHDEDLAHAIVDRILERGRMLTLDGPSLRTQHLGIDDATSPGVSAPPARISGIDRPEFPEPTRRRCKDSPECQGMLTSPPANRAANAPCRGRLWSAMPGQGRGPVLMLPLCFRRKRPFVGEILQMDGRFGTEGSEVQILSPRPIFPKKTHRIQSA
jgi:DNA replication protein DnaC